MVKKNSHHYRMISFPKAYYIAAFNINVPKKDLKILKSFKFLLSIGAWSSSGF